MPRPALPAPAPWPMPSSQAPRPALPTAPLPSVLPARAPRPAQRGDDRLIDVLRVPVRQEDRVRSRRGRDVVLRVAVEVCGAVPL
eukprot:2167414-Alexandrium_andersonii.AAC.1